MTLKCMQALVRVQARVLDQRVRQSHDGSRKSAFSDTNSLLESRYLQDIAERKSLVRAIWCLICWTLILLEHSSFNTL